MRKRYNWDTTHWVFFALAATSLVMFIVVVLVNICATYLVLNSQVADYMFYIATSIGLVSSLIAVIMYMTDVLAYLQEYINAKKGNVIAENETIDIATIDEQAINPLKGVAKDKEQLIINELCIRGKKQGGGLNRAPVAQLLKALQEEKLMQVTSLEKDSLMKWVCKVTGYKETNVSAFNEAINNATESKVEEARRWIRDSI